MLGIWRRAGKLACQDILLAHGNPDRNVLVETE